MKLRIELFVRNLEESVAFYRNILEFHVEKDLDQGYVSLKKDEVVIGLGEMEKLQENHPLKAFEGQRTGIGVEIVLQVDDVKELYQKVLSRGYPIYAELTERPWGLEDFRLTDPDGYYIRVTSHK